MWNHEAVVRGGSQKTERYYPGGNRGRVDQRAQGVSHRDFRCGPMYWKQPRGLTGLWFMGQHFFGNLQVQVTSLSRKPVLPTDYRVIGKDPARDGDLKRERDQEHEQNQRCYWNPVHCLLRWNWIKAWPPLSQQRKSLWGRNSLRD